jgi:hypothetical protein
VRERWRGGGGGFGDNRAPELNTDSSTTTISHNKITGNNTVVAGIKINGVEPTGLATVSTDTVTAFSTGAAIWVKNSSSIFTNNCLTDNKYAVHVQRGTAAIGTSSSSGDHVMIDNTRATLAEGVGPGICRTEVAPVVRSNLIQSNVYGLVTETTASPDLGTGSGDKGPHGVEMITSDDHAGLRAAIAARMPGVWWQRCQFHLQQNALACLPRQSMRADVANALRGVFDAPDRIAANQRLAEVVASYRDTAPRFAEWAETNLPEGLTDLALPSEYGHRLRTTNGLERLNREIKRRTRVPRCS